MAEELSPNALTVDVEDYFHVTAFEGQIDRDDWPSFASRVVRSTHVLLELLQAKDVRGTFFVLGWVAERDPELVHDIAAAGHEIGSHSYWHRLVYRQTPSEFREDLRRSRDVLEDITGQPITCYRAPTFSITKKSLWALEILVEEGFRVDSSIVPMPHDRYGMDVANPYIHQIRTPAGTICEFPPSVLRHGPLKLGIAGGGYFRFYPFAWTAARLRRLSKASGEPLMFYMYPWEVDPQQPRTKAGSRLSRFRHYVNLRHTAGRLERLLDTFSFASVSDVLAQRDEVGIESEHVAYDHLAMATQA